MADPRYVQWVAPECAAGTSEGAYTTTPAGIATALLWTVEIRIPAGHQGVTGIALVDSGHFVVPYDPTGPTWLIGDNDRLSYPYGKELGSNVVLATYNTGTYDHTWQVRLVYTPMSAYKSSPSIIEAPVAVKAAKAKAS